ncbi:hypothetical protein ANAPC5_01330 [Anaplasma phagocytophilum]|nr:hypothetical protein ANAPC5_01330 [Anaplasma phagocytophilum]
MKPGSKIRDENRPYMTASGTCCLHHVSAHVNEHLLLNACQTYLRAHTDPAWGHQPGRLDGFCLNLKSVDISPSPVDTSEHEEHIVNKRVALKLNRAVATPSNGH